MRYAVKSEVTLPSNGAITDMANIRQIIRDSIQGWKVLELPILTTHEVMADLKESSLPNRGFFTMLSLSAILATLGLIANSAAVIIGAMIVAPLMSPILALAFGLVRGSHRLTVRSLLTVVLGVIVVLLVSSLTAKIVGTRVIGSEIFSRAKPGLLDLGVALAAGFAGSFALTRRSVANALPGVAVAVALVPPLCVAGIGFAFSGGTLFDSMDDPGELLNNIENGALVLFLTNLAGIILAAGVVFVVHGYGSWKRGRIGLALQVAILIALGFPLTWAFQDAMVRANAITELFDVGRDVPEWEDAKMHQVEVVIEPDKSLRVELSLSSPKGLWTQEDHDYISDELTKRLGREVNLKMRVFETKIIKDPAPDANSSAPPHRQ